MRARQLITGAAILSLLLPLTLAADPLRVVTSFTILEDLTRQVAGDRAVVESLVGPDADAHVFEPAPRHARALRQADLVIINGLEFEGWMERLVNASGYDGALIRASAGIDTLDYDRHDDAHDDHHAHSDHDEHGHGHAHDDNHGHEHDDDHGHDDHAHGESDPHAWHDPRLAQHYVNNIAHALAERDPDHAGHYAERAEALNQRLQQLDAWVRAEFEAVPEAQRRAIIGHDSLAYYSNAYGVEFLFPIGWSTDAEPSAATVAALVRQLRNDNVRVLFGENVSDSRLLERLAEEGGGIMGGVLYTDALSPEDGPAGTYEAMIRHNTRTLVDALSQATPQPREEHSHEH